MVKQGRIPVFDGFLSIVPLGSERVFAFSFVFVASNEAGEGFQ